MKYKCDHLLDKKMQLERAVSNKKMRLEFLKNMKSMGLALFLMKPAESAGMNLSALPVMKRLTG